MSSAAAVTATLTQMSYLTNITNALAFYCSAIINPIGIVCSLMAALVFFSSQSLNKTNMGYLYGLLSLFSALSLAVDFMLAAFFNLLPLFTPLSFLLSGPLTIQNNNCILLGIALLIGLINWSNLTYYVTDVRLATLNQTISFRNGSIVLNRTILVPITVKYCLTDQSNALQSDLVSGSMRTWLPLVLIMLFNALTTRSLAVSRLKVIAPANSNNSIANKARHRREKNFTRTVMKMSIIFFVFNFPLSVSWIALNAYRACCSSTAASLGTVEILLFNKITIIMANLYQAMTTLFSLIFNTLFRREMKSRMSCDSSGTNGSTSFAAQSTDRHRSQRLTTTN